MYKILHVTLEYIYGIGGIKTVVNGLVEALHLKGVNNFVVTPFYDFFNIKYNNNEIKPIATIEHIYNRILHKSIIFQANKQSNIIHYLIQPSKNSPVKKIFDVGDPLNIYQAFQHSEPQFRIEYFNSAIASLIHNKNMPKFDIIHNNAWHTTLSACLIKEFKSTPIPKIISTVHMLSHDQGKIIKKNQIINTLKSVGLPVIHKFLDPNHNFNQMYLGLQYSDQVITVSQGLTKDAISDKSFGLNQIFNKLKQENRLHGITNGNNIINWDATLIQNLGEYALSEHIIDDKIKLKKYLCNQYLQLNNKFHKPWYLYVGRFSEEKGVDMLPHALEAINQQDGNLIIMGTYASKTLENLITTLKFSKNVIVIDNMQEQLAIGKYFRAACEFTIIPSYIEACGLVPMEAMASCSIPITSDVQGLPDTIISLINNVETGSGFIYENDINNKENNLKNIINIAYNNYVNWTQQNKINTLLSRLQKQAYQYDWNHTASDRYIELYHHTIQQTAANSPLINYKQPIINILHVALEYREATLGGLGAVTTQILAAQNKFILTENQESCQTIFNASIITPYYSIFEHLLTIHILDIKHIYNNQEVISSIYLHINNNNKHYLVKSCLFDLFKINNPTEIYSTLPNNTFIERIKYFNSAVAAFVNYNKFCINHPKPNLLQMHGWHTTLTAKLLVEYYLNISLKTIFTVHINTNDRGTYKGVELAGIGLEFPNNYYVLKQIGVNYADYIITVSPNLLEECYAINPHDCREIVFLKKAFLKAKLTYKITSILNGIDYKKYCYIKKIQINTVLNPLDIVAKKQAIKERLATELSSTSKYTIDSQLPVILYIGRFSAEKGIDTFKTIIKSLEKKAVFYALGKAIHNDILKMLLNNNIKHNVFITDDPKEQKKYGELMRACADFIFVPSHAEACGLMPMEGCANGSLCITSGVGGLQNTVTPFVFDHENNTFTGNSFIYEDYNLDSLNNTINAVLNLWENLTNLQKNEIHNKIIQDGKKFDWLTENGSIHQYLNAYNKLLLFQDKKRPKSHLRPSANDSTRHAPIYRPTY